MTQIFRKVKVFISLMPFLLHIAKGLPFGQRHSSGELEAGVTTSSPFMASQVELQLEKLKDNGNSSKHLSMTAPVKSELNLEKPAVSDNSPESIWDIVERLNKRQKEPFPNALKIDLTSTPKDIAEYIFWTGNEYGVTMALSELLVNHEVTKEEAIRFLEAVRVDLEDLQERFHDSLPVQDTVSATVKQISKQPTKTNGKLPPNPGFGTGNKPVGNLNAAPNFVPVAKNDGIWNNDYYDEIWSKPEAVERKESFVQRRIRELAKELEQLSYYDEKI